MGKLINQERRARSRAAKKERVQLILEAAGESFMRLPLAEVTLDGIGRRAKVRDGLPTLYFGSKEELFLRLLGEQLKSWSAAVEQELAVSQDRTPAALADLLAGSLCERPLLTRLVSLMHVVSEQTTDIGAAMTFQHNLETRLLKLGELLEEQAPVVEKGQGARLLHRMLLTAVGLRSAQGPLAPDAEVFIVDLRQELAEMVETLLVQPKT
jgi:AcrR family transcriptional regulator